jgi:PAS domain S-box-containing protein
MIERGELTGVVVTFSDVTERNLAEQALRSSEEKFRAVAATANDAIVSADAQGKIIYLNEAAERIFGHPARDILGAPLALLMPQTFRELNENGMRRFLPTGSPTARDETVELIGKKKDGGKFPLELSVATWKTGEETFFTAIIRDITDRKKAEEKIQQNLQRIRALHEIDLAITSTLDLRTTLDVLLERIDLFFEYSTASTVSLFNARSGVLEPVACSNLDETGWKAEKMKSQRSVAHAVFEQRKAVSISDVQSDPRIQNHAFFIKHGLCSYLGVPLMVRDEPLGVLGLYIKEKHDFSDQEVDFLTTLAGQAAIAIHNSQLHEETKKQAEALEKSNKVKDEFLSVMSHELRTPLIAILGYAGLLEDHSLGKVGAEQAKAARVIRKRADDLLAMIRTILEATRLEAGAMVLEREEVDIKRMLDDLAESYDIPSDKEVTIGWDYNGQLPKLLTDEGKLKQILQNLVSNALKFTHEGHVRISARPIADARCVEFCVTDTGIGIREDMVPMIFGKFRQLDSSATRPYEGVGLGLYIVKQFVELLGGSIEVRSELGKGSTFTVIIPEQVRSITDGLGRCAEHAY